MSTSFTKNVAERVYEGLRTKDRGFTVNVEQLCRPSLEMVRDRILQIKGDIVVNVTGGTKLMSLGAFSAAMHIGAPVCYLQSKEPDQGLHVFHFRDMDDPYLSIKLDRIIPFQQCFDLDTYLTLHADVLGRNEKRDKDMGDKPGKLFERVLEKAFRSFDYIRDVRYEYYLPVSPEGSTLEGGFAIDFVLLSGNQPILVEAKTGKKAVGMDAAKQLSLIAPRDKMGTYTKRVQVATREPAPEVKAILEARDIHSIVLPKTECKGKAGQVIIKDPMPEADINALRERLINIITK